METNCVPEAFRPIFWDVDWASMNMSCHRDFIIERILNMGDLPAVCWLWEQFSHDDIISVVKHSRRLSRKTARCWQNFFGLQEEEMACFGTYLTSPDKYY